MIAPKVSAGPMTVYRDADVLADEVAAWLIAKSAGRRIFSVCLSGGSTPKRLYEKLASAAYVERFPWERTHWFWGDERFVPADDPESNFRMTRRAMFTRAPVPDENIHRIVTEVADADMAAADYERTLKAFYGADDLDPARPLFDVTLLGLGPDGHTASLIPGEPVLDERQKWVAAVSHGRPEERITLTYPPLESSGAIAFLVTGAEKRDMLAHVRAGAEDVPAGRLRSRAESHWFVDRGAAGAEG